MKRQSAERGPATLWGMVTLKPLKSGKAARKGGSSSTNSGTYTASRPAARMAALCSAGLLLCETGLPITPYTCKV